MHFNAKLESRMEELLRNKTQSEQGTYERREYWYREKYDLERSAMQMDLSKTDEPTPLIQRKDIPSEVVNLFQAASEDIFGIKTPHDFQLEDAYQCMFKDDTVLVVSQGTSSGNTLLVDIARFFRRGVILYLEPLIGLASD